MRILHADDSEDVRDLLALVLENRGHTVTQVTNGLELLQKLTDPSRFDMVVTDNDMPMMKGLDALVRMRNDPATVNMPVVVLSADNIESRVLALDATYVDKSAGNHDKLWAAIDRVTASIK